MEASREWLRKEQRILALLHGPEPDYDQAVGLLDELAAAPGARKVCDMAALYSELADAYAGAGRLEEAIVAKQRALQAGLRSVPDGRADIAEYLLRLGRREEADQLFATLAEEYPDDVWLYNNAGMAYQAAGDHEVALRWLTRGLELALATGDPEGLVAQLSDLRRESLAALGRPCDDLERRADSFLEEHDRTDDPDHLDRYPLAEHQEPGETSLLPVGGRQRVQPAVAWFPPDELEAALARWPQWREVPEKRSYEAHRRAVQNALVRLKELGQSPALAPIAVDELVEWARREGRDPSRPESVAAYAALISARGMAVPWPPGRNEPCWCGSGRKYKKCCGGPAAGRPDMLP
ncbi:SEC-C metal-binding domain-containing protein [Carboxydochorda subterranea]|uniref:SEC-C metal-binding domain-containing protein n=1 Tax=Carboxydichorda subterranea TaxID=3109565 RepID=A0ABZ1BU69_9FIRM|nr:SEC-C metal-binding domain-containing protein [Limnochorda sp. L945t]WRP16066.1 SEC-C metal-binding domain-containing protein [Limnochorda sp. L945t]